MPAKMDEYCKQNGFAGWFETSAKDNVNIEESAKALVSKVRQITPRGHISDMLNRLFFLFKILFNDKLIHNDIDGDRLVLNADDPNNPKKKFCSC
jgi:Ras-related protein Rab-32